MNKKRKEEIRGKLGARAMEEGTSAPILLKRILNDRLS